MGREDFERSFLMVSPEYEAFSKQWFEVGIEHPSSAGYDPFGGRANVDYSPSSSPYTGFSPYAKSPYTMDFTSRLFNDKNCEFSAFCQRRGHCVMIYELSTKCKGEPQRGVEP